jgi:hypothetical protein
MQDDDGGAENKKDGEKKPFADALLRCAAIHGVFARQSMDHPENQNQRGCNCS